MKSARIRLQSGFQAAMDTCAPSILSWSDGAECQRFANFTNTFTVSLCRGFLLSEGWDLITENQTITLATDGDSIACTSAP